MNILVTGGTGLIGRAFINRYPQYSYCVLTRSAGDCHDTLPTRVDCIDSLDELSNLNEFGAVINLAGEPIMNKRWTRAQKEKITTSRWQTTETLIKLFFASSVPPATFLSGSAVGIYGDRGQNLIDEQAQIKNHSFPEEVCQQWEQIALKAQEITRVVILRTSIVLADNGGALAKMLPAFKLGMGGRLASGKQYMPWIHLDDMTRAINFLIENEDITGPVNMVAPESVTNAQFTEILAATLRRPARLPAPKAALKMALGESACLLLDSAKVRPAALQNAGFEFEHPQLSGALTDLLNG